MSNISYICLFLCDLNGGVMSDVSFGNAHS